ncbi:MAG: hypothetical protein K6E62_07040, partial [Lachnospiraceae bacterium]|nr:hypothetical protein [Lachnospiraceae bacterium]
MKRFIKSLKLLKYGLQAKTLLILTVFFFVAGVLIELFLANVGSDIVSGLYLSISGVYIYQLMVTPTASSLVQTSSYKYALQTKYPTIMTMCTTLFTFSIFVCLRVYRIANLGGREFSEATMTTSRGIFVTALLCGILLTYNGICFKKYILSFILLFAVVFLIIATGSFDYLSSALSFTDNFSYSTLIISSYALVVAGGILGWLVSILCYRMPIDALSVRSALR